MLSRGGHIIISKFTINGGRVPRIMFYSQFGTLSVGQSRRGIVATGCCVSR